MITSNRRRFVQMAVAAEAGRLMAWPRVQGSGKPFRLGIVIWLRSNQSPESAIEKVQQLGFPTCQVGVDEPTVDLASGLQKALEHYGVEGTTLLTLNPGPLKWDLDEGPLTIGLVPREFRTKRIDYLKKASDMAKKCGIPAVHTHCGFIPESPHDPFYEEVVLAVREVASYCRKNSQMFLFETGQETPVTLLRTILHVGLDNLGVNLDTANLILYGKGNPVDALDVLGRYVRGVHAKDGLFPTDPRRLGKEVPLGSGKANLPEIIRRLKELEYAGSITIEREIEGPQQIADLKKGKAYLEKLIG